MPLTTRGPAGATLAELVVALVITSIAGLIGVSLLAAAERRTRMDELADRAAQAARDVAHALGPDIAASDPSRVTVRGDTALDLAAHVGASVACTVAGNVLVVPGDRTTGGVPFSAWRSAPATGDIVLVWDTLATVWQRASVDSVASPRDGAGCPARGPFRTVADSIAGVPVTRFRLAAALPPAVGPGAPVRVYRDVRWMLYRSSDRQWWLGYRRCPGGVCGAAQPVAGPLAAPADSGLIFRIDPRGSVVVTTRAATDARSPAAASTRVWAVRGAPDGGA